MSNNSISSFQESKQYTNLVNFVDWITKRHEQSGGIVMLQSELDISRNFVNLYNFGRKCYENEPQEIFG